MQVTQEKRPGSQVSLTITLESEKVKETYEKRLRELTRNVQLKGFRRGKAPRKMVIQYIGATQINAAVLEDLINDSVESAIKDADIEAVGQFQFEGGFDTLLTDFKPDQDFSFTGTIDVQPEVKLGDYTGLEISATRTLFDPAQVDEEIDRYRQQRATLLPVEDRTTAEMGDVALVDFTGKTLDGEEIEGASATDFNLELEEDKFIPGFVSGIVGMAVDETKEIEAEFPEDYANEKVAGQKANFTVTIHELKTKELPELDDEFAKEISEFETVAELREQLTKNFTANANRTSFDSLDEALVDAITEGIEVELPESLIERETRFLIEQSLSQLQQQGLDPKQFVNEQMMEEMKERTRPDAISRLRRTLTLSAIVKAEKIEVGETELSVKVDEFLNAYQGQDNISPERVQSYFQEELLTEKVFKWLKEQNTISWVDGDGNATDAPVEVEETPAAEGTAVEAETETAADAVIDVDAAVESEADAEVEEAEAKA